MHAFATKQKISDERGSVGSANLRRTFSLPSRAIGRKPGACACGGGCPACKDDHGGPLKIQKKSLEISAPTDADEIQADEIARKVVDGQRAEIAGTSGTINRKGGGPANVTPEFRSKLETVRGGGQTLDNSIRGEMESKMGMDLSGVRIHAGSDAHSMSEDISARAFTLGQDIFFGRGEFDTRSRRGKELLAHELVHTVQQAGAKVQPKIQRAPVEKDPLCDTFDVDATQAVVIAQVNALSADAQIDKRQALIRTLKIIRRCATTAQQADIRKILTAALARNADAVWNEAGTVFGGYTGMYPGYATDIKNRLTNLGASETVPFGTFEVKDYPNKAGSPAAASKVAKGETPDLIRTDIVYFRGHQFAQYKAPGVFSDADIGRAFDLRYIDQKGGFPNVKLMISTSCATLCNEALDLFHAIFPNAVILGFGKSAPIEGAQLRNDFEAKLKALMRPLLLDQAADIASIISSWKSVIQARFKDAHSMPGYYDGTLHYWNGKAWHDVDPAIQNNKCKVKGDNTLVFPAPPKP